MAPRPPSSKGFILSGLALVILLGFTYQALSFHLTQVPSGHIARWASADHLTFLFNAQGHPTSIEAVRRALGRWQWSLNKAVHFYNGGTTSSSLGRDGQNTVVFLTSWPRYLNRQALAVTLTWRTQEGLILEGDIVFNQQEFKFASGHRPYPGHYSLEAIAAHELGHFLGLDHNDSPTCLMRPAFSAPDSWKHVWPDQDSIKGVLSLYGGGRTSPQVAPQQPSPLATRKAKRTMGNYEWKDKQWRFRKGRGKGRAKLKMYLGY